MDAEPGERGGMLRHVASLVLGLAIIGLIVYVGGIETLESLTQLDPMGVVLATLATLGITAAVAVRWGLIVRALDGRTVAWAALYHYLVVSRLLGYVLPKDVTDIGSRTACLTRFHDVPLASAGASVIMDRLFDAAMIVVVVLAVIPYWFGWITAELGLALMLGTPVLGAALLAAFHRPLVAIPIWALNTLSALIRRIRRKPPRPTPPLRADALDREVVLRAYLVSVVKFGFTAARSVLLGFALGLEISPALLVLATPFGQLTYVVAFTPGGLGIWEAGWVGTLRLGDVSLQTAMAFAVGQRVLTTVMIAGLTAISHVAYSARHRRTS